MKARRDFLDEAEYADYLKTYTTIAAMQGLLASLNGSDSDWCPNKENFDYISLQSVRMGKSVVSELYK